MKKITTSVLLLLFSMSASADSTAPVAKPELKVICSIAYAKEGSQPYQGPFTAQALGKTNTFMAKGFTGTIDVDKTCASSTTGSDGKQGSHCAPGFHLETSIKRGEATAHSVSDPTSKGERFQSQLTIGKESVALACELAE